MRQEHKPRNKMKTFAFILLGIFLIGLALRIILFFAGIHTKGIYSHAINYPILGSLIVYTILQVYYKTKKHRFL